MKILLINNGTKHISKLKKWMGSYTYDTADLGSEYSATGYDLVVLSGGSTYPVAGYESVYEKELELVKSKTIPVIGICLGFEIIALAFGHTPERMDRKEQGLVAIVRTRVTPFAIGNAAEFEAHRWCVKSLPDELVALAQSQDGVEVIRVKNFPTFGFQFHPEMTGDPKFADVVEAIQRETLL